MPDYKLNIVGTFNNKQLVKALRKAGIDVKKLGKETEKTKKEFGRFRTATAGMRRTIGAVRNNLLLVTFTLGTLGATVAKTVRDFAKFETVNLGFKALGKSVGFSAEALAKLKSATDGTVTSMELMKQANNAMLLGIVESEDQMADMFDMAQRLAAAVGQDAKYGIESLTTGIGRQSRLMLDNLGIIVKTEEAYKTFAKQINKNVNELTEQERKTAFITAAMDAARDKVEKLGREQKTVAMILSEASGSIGELSIALGKIFSPAVVATAKQITKWAESLRMLVFEFNVLRGIEIEETEMLELLDSKQKKLNATYHQWKYSLENTSTLQGRLTDNTVMLKFKYENLRAEVKKLTLQYLDTVDITETLAKGQDAITTSFGRTMAGLADLHPGLILTFELYDQTKEAQIALLESRMALITADAIAMEGDITMEENLVKMGLVYDMLAEKLVKLIGVKNKDADTSEAQLTANSKLAKGSAALVKQFAGGYKAAARLQQTAALIDAWSGANTAIAAPPKGYGPTPVGWTMYAAALTSGIANAMSISKSIGEFKTAATGMNEIVSQPTMVLAGESGPESVQITPLDSNMNQNGPQGGGDITLNISSPLVDETVVDSIIPAIREAIRRGEDIGIS